MNNITFGDEDTGYYETVAGGAGAVCIQLVFFEPTPTPQKNARLVS